MFLESDTVNIMTSQVALVVQNLPANAGDAGSIPGLERSLGRGTWWVTVHWVAKSWT